MDQKLKTLRISAYIAAFFLAWWIVVVFPLAAQPPSRHWGRVSFFLLKVLVWVAPAFFYVGRIDRKNPWVFMRISTDLKRGLEWSLGLVVLLGPLWMLSVVALGMKSLDFSRWTFLNLFGALVTAAIIEEVNMRGFVLNQLRDLTGFWKANLLTGLLFVAFHWQAWFFLKPLYGIRLFQMSLSILCLSLASGYLVRKSNSIWPSVVLHGIQNLIALL